MNMVNTKVYMVALISKDRDYEQVVYVTGVKNKKSAFIKAKKFSESRIKKVKNVSITDMKDLDKEEIDLFNNKGVAVFEPESTD